MVVRCQIQKTHVHNMVRRFEQDEMQLLVAIIIILGENQVILLQALVDGCVRHSERNKECTQKKETGNEKEMR